MNSIRNKKAAFSCLFFLVSFIGKSQDQPKKIIVCEENTKMSLPDIQLEVICDDKTVLRRSNLFGEVYLSSCPPPSLSRVKSNSLYYKLDQEFIEIPDTLFLKKTEFAIHQAEVTTSISKEIKQPYFFSESNVHFIPAKEFQANDLSTIRTTMNTIPGVKMDERGNGGSRRISIRGSFVRSPFAVRNIGLYYDGVPLTGADGSSPLEMIDTEDLANSVVLKGPNSVFHSGNGGVLAFDSYRPKALGTKITQSFSAGSFNYLRSRTGVDYRGNKGWISASFVQQQTDGYRDQESNQKSQFILKSAYNLNAKLNLYSIYQHYDGSWDLPGSINLETAQTEPQSANAYSEDINASVSRTTDLVAMKMTWDLPRIDWNNTTSIYFSNTDKSNPYGTSAFFNGLKEESGIGYGGRTEFKTYKTLGINRILVRLGAEWQTNHGRVDEFPLVLNQANDVLKYSVDTDFERTMLFAKVDLQRRRLHLIPSLNFNNYNVSNDGYSFALDTALNGRFQPDAKLLKGLEFLYRGDFSQVSIAYQEGLSNPGQFELIDVETGILNSDLQAETGQNFELTLRRGKPGKYFAEIKAYTFILNESILPVIDENDVISYTNGGKAFHDGLEFYANKTFRFTSESVIEYIVLGSSFAYQQYKTEIDGGEYAVPGVPYSTWSNRMQILFGGTFTLDIDHYWSDQLPLDRLNEDHLNAYNVLNTRLTWEKRKSDKFNIKLFAGINNLTNTLYTSFPQINAFGGRYYNPAPGLNYYGGIKASLEI